MSADIITLVNSADMVAQINSEKVLVAVPLLYTFMVAFLSYRLIIYSRPFD